MRNVLLVGEAPGKVPVPPSERLTGPLGMRICALSAITMAEYRERTERLNLFDEPQPRWNRRLAAQSAAALWPRLFEGHTILLGSRVADAFGFGEMPLFEWIGLGYKDKATGWVAKIPHPSGRNRFWNDATNRAEAEAFLRQALQGGSS